MRVRTWMHWIEVAAAMCLFRYLKPVGGLPDPRGELSAWISSRVIAEAKKEVQQAINNAMTPKHMEVTQSTLHLNMLK